MINIYSASGFIFVWNAEDVMTLRKEHRIVGSLVGIHPNKQFQVQTKYLPLLLMYEEAHLLMQKGVAQLLKSPEEITDPSAIESYFTKRDEACNEQAAILKEKRKEEILNKADEIYAGKKRKHLETKEECDKKAEKSDCSAELSLTSNDKSDCDSTPSNKISEVKESPEKCQELYNNDENADGESVICDGEEDQELMDQSDGKGDSVMGGSTNAEDSKPTDSFEELDKQKSDEICAGKKRKHLGNKVDCDKKAKKSDCLKELSPTGNNDKSDCDSNPDKISEVKESPEKCQELVDLDNDENADGESVIYDGEGGQELMDQSDCKDDSVTGDSKNAEDSKPTDSFEDLDKQKVIEAEIAKIPEVNKELCMVQLFTESPFKNMSNFGRLYCYPSFEEEKLRYAAFKDLWEKGYYITDGLKFGGDFLVYEGDPIKYHATFIVVCLPYSSKFQAIDVLTYGRLGHQVKKTVALASVNEFGKVEYISISLANDLS